MKFIPYLLNAGIIVGLFSHCAPKPMTYNYYLADEQSEQQIVEVSDIDEVTETPVPFASFDPDGAKEFIKLYSDSIKGIWQFKLYDEYILAKHVLPEIYEKRLWLELI